MADSIARNVDESLMQRLRQRAQRHSRSDWDELWETLRAVLIRSDEDPNAEFKGLAAASRIMSAGRKQTPSEVLLRKSRDKEAKQCWTDLTDRRGVRA